VRRILICLVGIFALLGLCRPASAANAVTDASFSAVIAENGSCQVTLELQLLLDAPADSFSLPLPATARGVTVNGSSARASRDDTGLTVDLSSLVGGTVGAFTVRVQYTLSNVLAYSEQGVPSVELPMLSGFSLPLDRFAFTVTLPGDCQAAPQFHSGYYQQSIEADMLWSSSGNRIEGSMQTELKGQETLTMRLTTPEGMFPAQPIGELTVGFLDIAMMVVAALALLYWLIFLSVKPVLRSHSASAPEGCTAGEVPCRLLGQGADLTMTVFSWAQLGYILIHTDDHGRVMLHKRMEMGNERSSWEVRVFQDLFGKRSMVEGTGYRYANLCRRVALTCPGRRSLYRRGGSVRLFRVLAASLGLLGGIDLGIRLAGDALLGVLLIALLALTGAAAAWLLQGWLRGAQLHYRYRLPAAAGAAVFWIVIGLLAGEFTKVLYLLLAQLLAGLLADYGGRRTEMGRQQASELLGLRHYLKSLSGQELQHIQSRDPYYFFSLLPFALMLGVEKRFARQFGSKRLPACPWLTSGMDSHMTAIEWSRVARQTVQALDRLQRRLPLERLTGKH